LIDVDSHTGHAVRGFLSL